MMEEKQIIHAPVIMNELIRLKAGDAVYLSGTVYTGRDAAHKRLVELIRQGQPLPIPLQNQALYYTGSSPAKPGQVIGSCGPTSSYRMDAYTPLLLEQGLKLMIGKGPRAAGVVSAIRQHQAVYLAAIGGAGALISCCITAAKLICFAELGTEAIYQLQVENFPLVVAIDAQGNNLYETGPARFRQTCHCRPAGRE